jgi:hypothetical protein
MNAPHDLTYFIDRDLGLRFADSLKSAGLRVERADDHFKNDTADEIWLPEVASRGWVAVTRDTRIRYSPLALTALMTSGARLLVIVGKLTSAEAANVFLAHRKKIERLVHAETNAFVAKVRRDGVHRWLSYRAWAKRNS